MIIFSLFMLSFVAFVQFYICKRLTLYIKTTKLNKFSKLIPPIFITLNLPVILIFLIRTLKLQITFDLTPVIYTYSIWQGTTIFIFIVMIIGKVISVPLKLLPQKAEKKFDSSRRKFIQTTFTALSTYALVGSTIGTVKRDDHRIEKVKIKIKNLPDELKGLTIALISDIHSGPFMNEEEMYSYAVAINSLEPDLILMPGDFITSDPEEIYPFVNVFKNLNAKYGVFATLGNHEFFAKQPRRIARIIEENGIRVLRNESEKININREEIYIIGIDDLRYGADLDKAMKNVKDEKIKILLSHKPYDFPNFAKYGIQLTVSGHTHGGQIVFAKIDDTYITPASIVSRFVAGHYKIGDSHLYVTRGLGTVGLPIRLNCPPEITHIILA